MWKRIRHQRFRELQKALEEIELNKRYSSENPGFHDQVKVMEEKLPERQAQKSR